MKVTFPIMAVVGGLIVSTCAPIQPDVSLTLAAQNQGSAKKALNEAPPRPTLQLHRWTCTASGAGMLGTCQQL